MLPRALQQTQIQFDYFSDNFRRFETDFYRYSALNIPLTFITDDILLSMAEAQSNFFKLNATNALDRRDHYYYFTVHSSSHNQEIRIYHYTGHTLTKKRA